jgi:hypothetical protein
VAITVYTGGFGLVREVRDVPLAEGRRVALEYQDVSTKIQPETVHLRPLGAPDAFRVLEQNYRYDLLSPEKLLEKYVGRKVKVVRWNEAKGQDETREAEVLAVQRGPVLKIDGEITYQIPGRLVFPEVPKDLIAKPTLVWLLASYAPRERVELSYLTQGLGWDADYVLVVNADDTKADLLGWVTLTNETGTSFDGATLKLVAGDVQRYAPPPAPPREEYRARYYDMLDAAPQFKEESFFEYHLYTLERPTTLLDREKKQVSLLEGHGAAVSKKLVIRAPSLSFDRAYDGELASPQHAGVFLEIQNSEKNHLGIPLPKGVVRVYKADKGGSQEFIGEDRIDHTPRDEKIEVRLGEAFDVVAEHEQTRFEILDKCQRESDWEVSIRNHKDTSEAVTLEAPVTGDTTVVRSSVPVKEKDARRFKLEAQVPARGEVKITYSVRVRSC